MTFYRLKRLTIVIISLTISLIVSIFWISNCIAENESNVTTQLLLSIIWWRLNIWISGDWITLHGTWWSFVTWQFNYDSFWVDDQNGSTKYWTTISTTDLVYKSGDIVRVISWENIGIKMWDGVHTISGLDNPWITINPELSGSYKPLNWPIKYVSYDTPNGILWIYGDNPEIIVNIPLEASSWCTQKFPCKYKWTITYTLYEDE